MQVTKLLRINGSREPNAVLLLDQTEEYPVFLESLHNAVYFNELLNSGYKFTAMPYGFVKDGRSIMSLPVEDITVSGSKEEEMYNFIGAPLPFDELKAKIDTSAVVSRDTPSTHYTITTREEFIDYLNGIAEVELDDDFQPLNYFVAPEARFSVDEYRDEKFDKYVSIINSRRTMSIKKFQKLFKWLQNFGMSERADSIDVIEAYFAWGLDGLDFPIIGSHREQKEAELTAGNAAIPCYKRTYGLLDNQGSILVSEEDKAIRWELPSNDPTYMQDMTRGLAPGDTIVSEFRCRVKQNVIVLEGPQYDARISKDRLVLLRVQYPTLRILSPVTLEHIPIDIALPHNKHLLNERFYIEALAKMLYDKRKCTYDVSSFKALTTCGAGYYDALNYIATQDEMDKTSPDGEGFIVMDYDVKAFVEGDKVADNISDYLHGILDGVHNVDKTAAAKEAEGHVNLQTVYNELSVLHNVMGIPLNELYERINSITDEDKVLVFSNRGMNHTLHVSPMRMSLNGYLSDVQSYDLQCAERCCVFNYITNVAREVGINECDRHVGIEFLMVIRKEPVNNILKEIESFYVSKVEDTITDVNEKAQLMGLRHLFKLSRFFEIALKGTCTLPSKLGGQKLQVSAGQQSALGRFIERRIETITCYTMYTMGGSTERDMGLDMYCVNAYVTPERVIPRKGYTIHEAAFYALWNDYSMTNPDVHAQLVSLGVIPNGFQAWSYRYSAEQFASRDLFDLDDETTLLHYNEVATNEQNTYPADVEFHSVTHPVEYLNPGIFNEEKQPAKLDIPRQGSPVVRLGYARELTLDDMKQYLYPEEIDTYREQYLDKFEGFAAEGFYLCDDIMSRLPSKSTSSITVSTDGEHVYLPNQDMVTDFRNIVNYMSEYGIVNVYGRIYLFIASDGVLWEARI